MLGLALLVSARPLRAQQPYIEPPPQPGASLPPFMYPSWTGQLAVLGGNALLGGLTAGVTSLLRGGDFDHAFTVGVLGGAVVYVGKRVAAAHFDGAGLAGREVGAVGTAMVANVGRGAGALDRVRFPLGPVSILVDRQAGRRRVSARVELIPLAALAYGIGERHLVFDTRASLSAGTPVFRAPNVEFRRTWAHESRSTGMEFAGSVWISQVPHYGLHYERVVFAHERVHVLQMDFFNTAWTGPLETWLRGELGSGAQRGFGRYIGLGLGEVVLDGLGFLVPHHNSRPWEIEANFLENR